MPDASQNAPVSTYRLQFHGGFTFEDATRVVPYLHRLGVTHCYSSPYLMARPGSTHGYDICDHTRLNPEVGSREEYDRFVGELRGRGMGQILDFVPNHMGIDPRTNPWWRDVLENGQSSPFAHFFDIDWEPVKPELRGRVLLPILAEQYGLVLERGDLRLVFEEAALHLDYFDHHLPINPRQAVRVYEHELPGLTAALGEDHPDLLEYLSIMTALRNLPTIHETDPSRIAERQREKEVARGRLTRLVAQSAAVREHIERAVAVFNGTPGQPETFDPLHALLEQQAYRLSDWRSAGHEINYRRFFDNNALAALRMEQPEVFEATHVLVAELIRAGAVSGFRIDHPDGLYDPALYFQRLQVLAPDGGGPVYVLAEKILSEGEVLPDGWPIAGTTGYAFANEATRLLADPSGERALRQFYSRFTGLSSPFADVVYESKKLITRSSLASELNVLAHALNRISESNRRSRDFTLESLRGVLQEVVACFPVYRTYITTEGWRQADRDRIEAAVLEARRRNPAIAGSQFDFFREVVLPRRDSTDDGNGQDRRDGYAPVGRGDYERRLAFSMKLQQFTAPVQAKGVEDTAFYRYNLLVSLNEVGGEPSRMTARPADVHAFNEARADRWPQEMLTTATHDTKLGEDVRARITVLSEIPGEWRRHVARWARINAGQRAAVSAGTAPDRNDEYRFYQVLVGAWPTAPDPTPPAQAPDELVGRMRQYMLKAIKEAKVHTSWVNDDQAYDQGVDRFVERSLNGPAARKFLASFVPFQARVARLAVANSLAQLVLKLASPGVPDFYQGTELWDLNLVDPDNRRPVDFDARAKLLDGLDGSLQDAAEGRTVEVAGQLLDEWVDGRIKLWVTAAGLRLRRSRPDVFLKGRYCAAGVQGDKASHVFALARAHHDSAVVAVVARFVSRLGEDWRASGTAWGDTRVVLPPEVSRCCWGNVLTGDLVETQAGEDGAAVVAAEKVLRSCPVALLASR
jgi:(1->4)-alpha-D-glucan 1-alpha-D-glucosylmutase